MIEPLLVLSFEHERARDVRLAGGKGASLASMTHSRLPVPPGFIVTAEAFLEAVDSETLLRRMQEHDVDAVRDLIAGARPPRELIKDHYDKLSPGPVAVRSSACAEDGDDASYAGQQETYLFVEDFEEVMQRIVDCWLSFFSERALFYRRHKGSLEDVAMAVVVQRMVDATKAGVMFTADPVTGRRDRIIVEASRGIGEHVVSGEVTPDYYALDKKGVLKKSRLVNDQLVSAEELAQLARLGVQLAETNGGPQDIEWAFDDTGLYMLQSRPITTL